jgi:hypothetical protein
MKTANQNLVISPLLALACHLALSSVAVASTSGSLAGAGAYNDLYPTYAEVCAVSQIEQVGQAEGGYAGHGVMYLKGACRDTRVGYPRLALCEDLGRDPKAPTSEVAISVDQVFSNVNWVAVDDKAFFFSGNLGPDDKIGPDALAAAEKKAIDSGIFKGVKFHESYRQSFLSANHLTSISDEEFLAQEAIGTDYALDFGRNVYCSRFPLPAIQGKPVLLKAVIDYLNALNDRYQKTNDYEWNAYGDNCTHIPHNALAAAGIVDPIAMDQFFPIQLFSLAVPANEFVGLTSLQNDPALDDLSAMGRTAHVPDNLINRNWIPVQPGGLVELFPMHLRSNVEFEKSPGILLLSIPILAPNDAEFDRVQKDPKYTDVLENLKWFAERYEAAIEHQHSKAFFEWTLQALDPGFNEFYDKYYAYVSEQLTKVKAEIAEISARP